MKLNLDKCNSLVSGFKYKNIWAKCEKTKIWEINNDKLLGTEIGRS